MRLTLIVIVVCKYRVIPRFSTSGRIKKGVVPNLHVRSVQYVRVEVPTPLIPKLLLGGYRFTIVS